MLKIFDLVSTEFCDDSRTVFRLLLTFYLRTFALKDNLKNIGKDCVAIFYITC